MEVEEAVLVGVAVDEGDVEVVSAGINLDGIVMVVCPRVAVVGPTVGVGVTEGLKVVFLTAVGPENCNRRERSSPVP